MKKKEEIEKLEARVRELDEEKNEIKA